MTLSNRSRGKDKKAVDLVEVKSRKSIIGVGSLAKSEVNKFAVTPPIFIAQKVITFR